MDLNWTNLLNGEKLYTEPAEPERFKDYPRSTFEKDYDKIVSSAAFRRLQDKTQVFPLDKSDFVRTRLTHSIEVSSIAKQLGIMISKNKTDYRPADINEAQAEDIAAVLSCAGLLHDLGNPPFGHFGETTIGEWFKENLDTLKFKNETLRDVLRRKSEQLVQDLENFEGNAQALRILAKAQYGNGINVSFAVLGTLMKYPTDSLSFSKGDADIKKHKLGHYFSENECFSQISEKLGTISASGAIARHPLTFLLEAADDIAYTTADLEDAFKKNLFSLDAFIAFFEAQYSSENVISPRAEYFSDQLINDLKQRRAVRPVSLQDSDIFHEWVVYARKWLMYVAVYRFSRSYKKIMSGKYTEDLFFETNHALTIKILKKAMTEFVFNSVDILKLELSSQTILSFLLNKFVHAVLYFECVDGEFSPSKADKKYLALLSDNYKNDYLVAKTGDEAVDLYARLLMVADYISGMTDSYARTLYRELSGIE